MRAEAAETALVNRAEESVKSDGCLSDASTVKMWHMNMLPQFYVSVSDKMTLRQLQAGLLHPVRLMLNLLGVKSRRSIDFIGWNPNSLATDLTITAIGKISTSKTAHINPDRQVMSHLRRTIQTKMFLVSRMVTQSRKGMQMSKPCW